MKQILKIFEAAVLVLLIAFLLYVNITYYIWKQITIAVVEGSSMNPLLYNGDIVIVLPPNSINLGDIIIFKNDYGEFVIHRVVGIINCSNTLLYITKGDNNQFIDQSTFIAYKSSVECPQGKKITLKSSFADFNKNLEKALGNTMRGINTSRIVGKVLQINNVVIKISGLITH